jgi:hypothetical protein
MYHPNMANDMMYPWLPCYLAVVADLQQTDAILQCDNPVVFPSKLHYLDATENRDGESVTVSGETDCKLNESVNVLQIYLVGSDAFRCSYTYSKKPKPHIWSE